VGNKKKRKILIRSKKWKGVDLVASERVVKFAEL
jgi:hypothetical protein